MHGHLFPAVAVLNELRRRGHQVAVRTLSTEVERLVSLGFEARSLAGEIESLTATDWRARSPVGNAARATKTFLDRAAYEGPDLRDAIAEERPDAVLVDIATWGAMAAAESWGGPWAAFCPMPLPLRSRDAPPFGPGFRPARGYPGRLRDRLTHALSRHAFDRLALGRLNRLRGELGAASLVHAEDLFGLPPLLLYMSAEGFDYRRSDWPANVVAVGPCGWDPPCDLPDDLSQVTAPLVLVTTSTDFQNDGRLVEVALKALADEPVHVVATLPAARIERVGLPANATLAPFVPHSAVLARAACAITHGGMGATQKALALGVPVCAVPFGRDQREVARRVQVARAGTLLDAPLLSPRRLRHKVRKTIAMREGAERVAAAYRATGGVTAAADAFERLLSR